MTISIFVPILLLILILYYLYRNGFLFLNNKRALTFIASDRGKAAKFSSCTGSLKRVLFFHESRSYHFTFSCELSKGQMSVELQDEAKQPLFCLSGPLDCANLTLEKGRRYYIVYRFQSATGKYRIDWN